jgi:hypothetical protein
MPGREVDQRGVVADGFAAPCGIDLARQDEGVNLLGEDAVHRFVRRHCLFAGAVGEHGRKVRAARPSRGETGNAATVAADEAAVAGNRAGDFVDRAKRHRVGIEGDPVIAAASIEDRQQQRPGRLGGERPAPDGPMVNDLRVAAVMGENGAILAGERAVVDHGHPSPAEVPVKRLDGDEVLQHVGRAEKGNDCRATLRLLEGCRLQNSLDRLCVARLLGGGAPAPGEDSADRHRPAKLLARS